MSSQPLSPLSNAPGYAPAIEVPSYLRWHWAVVLLGNYVTNNLFGWVWLVLQANWVRKVTGSSKAYKWAIASLIVTIGVMVFACIGAGAAAMMHDDAQTVMSVLVGLFIFAGLIVLMVLYIGAAFALRRDLEGAPFGMKLSGPMTFFFNSIYFQYHLQNWGLPGQLGGPPIVYAAPPPPLQPPPPPVTQA